VTTGLHVSLLRALKQVRGELHLHQLAQTDHPEGSARPLCANAPLLATHLHMYETLQATLNALPNSVTLSRYTLDADRSIRSEGTTTTFEDVNALLNIFRDAGYTTIAHLTTDTLPDQKISFSLKVTHSAPSPKPLEAAK